MRAIRKLLPVLAAQALAILIVAQPAAASGPTDPFTSGCAATAPYDHRKIQWALGSAACGLPTAAGAVNAEGAWNYAGAGAGQPGHAVIGVLDAGPAAFTRVSEDPAGPAEQSLNDTWGALGYFFTPLQDGQVEALGARIRGAHTVRLFGPDGVQLAFADIPAATTDGLWVFVDVPPVEVSANVRYSVAVSIPPRGIGFYTSGRMGTGVFPQTYGAVRVDGGASGGALQDGMAPFNLRQDALQGFADVRFRPSGALLAQPVIRDRLAAFETTVHADLAGALREHLSPSWGAALRAVAPTGPDSPFGHGMHVGGLLAGTWNAVGTAGLCRDCSLLWGTRAIRISDAIQLRALVDAGVQLVNLSGGLGGGASEENQAAVHEAAAADVVFLVSAGNGTNEVAGSPRYVPLQYPAADPDTIGVAGTTFDGTRWQEPEGQCRPGQCGSNWDPINPPDVAAPARRVLSGWYPGDNFADWLSPEERNFTSCGDGLHDASDATGATGTDGFGLCTGTSMSAPLATGVAALVRSTNPLLSRGAVRDVLVRTARNPAAAPDIGAGIVDAGAAQRETLGHAAGQLVRNRLTPLFDFYSATAGDHLYTTSPQAARVAALGRPRRRFASNQDPNAVTEVAYVPGSVASGPTALPFPYQLPGGAGSASAAAFLFTTPVHPSTGTETLRPLLRMSWVGEYRDETNDIDNPNHIEHAYTTSRSEVSRFASVGYRLDGVEGYVFPSSYPGAEALYRRYNPALDDFAIFPASQLAAMAAQGYTSNYNTALYPDGIIGFVYPNVDRDADGLIDGFEAVLGTNPLTWDSDGDGLSDGQEALNYVEGSGYGDPLSPPVGADLVIEGSTATGANSARFDTALLNMGPATAQAVHMDVTLRSTGTFASITLSSTCTLLSSTGLEQRYRCSSAGLAVGQRLQAVFVVDNYCAVTQPITATVTASAATPDPWPSNNTGTLQPSTCARADLVAEALATTTATTLSFDVGAFNAGPAVALNPTLDVVLRSSSTLSVSSSACTLLLNTGLEQRYRCTAASIAAGARLQRMFVVNGYCALTAPVTVDVVASAATFDPLPANNSRTVAGAVCPSQADLAAEASATAGANSMRFDAGALNLGPTPATAATLDVVLRSSRAFAVVSTCTLVSSATGEHRYRCPAADLAVGQRVHSTFDVPNYCSLQVPITFEVSATATTADPLLANNSRTIQGAVREGCPPAADMSMKLVIPKEAAQPGFDWLVHGYAGNNGPSAASGTQVLVEFRSNTLGWSIQPLVTGCTPRHPTSNITPFYQGYTCPLGVLAPAASITLEPFFGVVGPLGTGTLKIQARISSSLPDLWPANDLASNEIKKR